MRIIVLALLLTGLITSCNNKNDNPILKMSNIEIKAQLKTQNSVSEQIADRESSIVFTGDEIVSYNGKTGEIVFKNINKDETIKAILEKFNDELEFYKDGELLFKLKSKVVIDIESAIYNTPILYYNACLSDKNNGKLFILDGYPWGLTINKDMIERRNERIQNVENILNAWDIFIETLKKEGKYIE